MMCETGLFQTEIILYILLWFVLTLQERSVQQTSDSKCRLVCVALLSVVRLQAVRFPRWQWFDCLPTCLPCIPSGYLQPQCCK